ncbi:hypothetical protein HYX16_01370 [Candidatus Woesearchaeota archaeon]|nr:hypothetical protein [Candidatus Woesearchaeota archaeon]
MKDKPLSFGEDLVRYKNDVNGLRENLADLSKALADALEDEHIRHEIVAGIKMEHYRVSELYTTAIMQDKRRAARIKALQEAYILEWKNAREKEYLERKGPTDISDATVRDTPADFANIDKGLKRNKTSKWGISLMAASIYLLGKSALDIQSEHDIFLFGIFLPGVVYGVEKILSSFSTETGIGDYQEIKDQTFLRNTKKAV